MLFAVLWLTGLPAVRAQEDNGLEQLRKLTHFYRNLHGLYVDTVDMAPLVETAIRSMLLELDPHSAYLDREEMEQATLSFNGSFGGIGIEFRVLNDTIRVMGIVSGGPAEQVGLRTGDRIVRIDGEGATGLRQSEVPERLRGEVGSRVQVTARRPSTGEFLDFDITRDNIPLHTVDAAYRLGRRTAYVRINRFGSTTMEEFGEALERLAPVDTLVLDLQGNGGGLLNQALGMAGTFLEAGAALLTTEGRAVPAQTFRNERRGRLAGTAVVVLIDENSASASEIVAGAIQDWDRGVVIGRPSFGKGLVQRQILLGDGSAARLTIARYHTPSGRVIQRPYEKGHRTDYYAAHADRLSHRRADTLSGNDSLPGYRTLRTGRTVRGGGGIRPDLPVEADTSHYTEGLVALVRRNLIGEYAFAYLDRHRAELLERHPDYPAFAREFRFDDPLWESLLGFAAERGTTVDAAATEASRHWIGLQFRAYVAGSLYGPEARVRVWNDGGGNPALDRALMLLARWEEEVPQLLGEAPERR